MDPLWLRVRAPFAAYRWMQAGAFRATMPVMPPSAAHGLVLNLAGIETRGDTSRVSTPIRPDVPCFEVAVGASRPAATASVLQQLHAYPVGSASRELAARTFGAKYHIAPVRREILVDCDFTIGVRGHSSELAERIRAGLVGTLRARRYGLPFAGDNNFLLDRIDVLAQPDEVTWYERFAWEGGVRVGSTRLTVGIDREDASRTTLLLFAPAATPSREPTAAAWTWTPRAPA
jgi:CRISPR-associated protein Cas5t